MFLFVVIIGGFPIEIKTKIRHLIICCCHNFIRWKYDKHIFWDILFWFYFPSEIHLIFSRDKIMITTNNKISYFGSNFNRKSTFILESNNTMKLNLSFDHIFSSPNNAFAFFATCIWHGIDFQFIETVKYIL